MDRVNDLLNAILAIVEGRPSVARPLLTHVPGQDVSRLHARIYAAFDSNRDQAVLQTLKEILRKTMSLRPGEGSSIEEEDAFYFGVAAVEAYLEAEIQAIHFRQTPVHPGRSEDGGQQQ